ncbi:alginate export family protein [Geotalea uraniireducens]|uniref:Alginate export family protein n=1 Tax=Geotalea uraniireducens TaxID=351604 RepID=A0ABM8EIJ3_9BACT|nr:alginate export family protein [Geotalea uraniireducens]BDV42225.1 alginate export family protein [Geotalea uraniireducens]
MRLPPGLGAILGIALVILVCRPAHSPAATGATADAPPYALNRADEDYRYLRNPANRLDFWDPLKYLPLDGNGSWFLSIGGEARERYEYFNRPNWGQGAEDHGYFLQRYFLHGDLHLGDHARFFTQFQSSLEDGRRGGPRPAIDEDQLDVHQLFLDLAANLPGDSSLTLRSGRQELAYGSQRLISVREGPNVRQSFDGFRLIYRKGDIRIDGFAAKPALTNRHVFDDGPDNTRALWGAYAVLPCPPLAEAHLDLYYIGLFRRTAGFDQGTARETRHSAGARLWRTALPVDYNFEALYQWGSFGNGDIRAWTVASDTGYTLVSLPLRPRIGLRADIASGDEDPANPDLQTFNPLFPKGAYFSEAGLIGPANFIDLNPCLDLHLTDKATITFDWDFFWRESTRDGLYNNAVALVRSGETSNARYIGSMAQTQLFWNIDRHLSFVAIYGHFFAGRFLKEAGPGNDVDYLTTWLSYKF